MSIEDLLSAMSEEYKQIELSYDGKKRGWKLKASGGEETFHPIEVEHDRAKNVMDEVERIFLAYKHDPTW
jgi:hypothetical protein